MLLILVIAVIAAVTSRRPIFVVSGLAVDAVIAVPDVVDWLNRRHWSSDRRRTTEPLWEYVAALVGGVALVVWPAWWPSNMTDKFGHPVGHAEFRVLRVLVVLAGAVVLVLIPFGWRHDYRRTRELKRFKPAEPDEPSE